MERPLIGISGRRWPAALLGDRIPRAMSDVSFDLHFSDYPRSIALAGGLPVELARDADVEALVGRLDGLVLTGGADVDPAQYGALPDEQLGPLEPERDEWELALLRAARDVDLPILAICRGLQLVNVAFGGTLCQHVELDDGVGHPQWDVSGRQATHTVLVTPESMTAALFSGEIGVNSLHHQVVDVVASSLNVSAVAPDGVVEGLESEDGSILAVQWHPELLDAPDPTFSWIVREATKRRAAAKGA
ncbi:MAG TPA: gamma-glutamyl-gamma-aminobutyrate hydrolase family protein [Acidimicrobiales bacterium]|nr:gamma-glutamyl-gamma-aminobutyrate hydrolase family protein [Acidimicrobiales bacterium]